MFPWTTRPEIGACPYAWDVATELVEEYVDKLPNRRCPATVRLFRFCDSRDGHFAPASVCALRSPAWSCAVLSGLWRARRGS